MALGAKRNFSHTLCDGDFIVYMDDDDYYFPQRVSHAVETLSTSGKEIAGTTILPIFFEKDGQLWLSGPFGDCHATANTFAMTKEFSVNNNYDKEAQCNEERAFLKDYTIPMAQLDPWKSIICISHASNTFDKMKMRENGEHPRMRRIEATQGSPLLNTLLSQSEFFRGYNIGNTILNDKRQLEKERRRFFAAGHKSNCDKITHHGYGAIYPLITASLSNSIDILEIGYGHGNSAQLWKEIFPKSSLTFLDRDVSLEQDRLKVLRCDQSNKNDLIVATRKLLGARFQLIIDDGSHVPKHQIDTFAVLFELLDPGGYYVIEDIETSYWRQGNLYGYAIAPNQAESNYDLSTQELFKLSIEYVNREFKTSSERTRLEALLARNGMPKEIAEGINSITFSHNLIAINKTFPEDIAKRARDYRFGQYL